MPTEPLSAGKFFSSFFQALPWVKTARYVIGAALIIGVPLAIFFLCRPRAQNTTFTGNVGKVSISQDGKRTFIPFVEGGIEKNTAGHRDFDSYIRAGLRFEF